MRRARVVVAVVAACLVLPSLATADDIRIRSTTDTVDAGLVDGLLASEYFKVQPGDTLRYTGEGTGAAIQSSKNGLADVVITHAPTLEAGFVADGWTLGLGRQIFYSDYVIVGPADDPAGVALNHKHDAISAFEDIAQAAEGDPTHVQFNSRGENSGTNVQEQVMWNLADTQKVDLQPAAVLVNNQVTNPAGRKEPYSGTGTPGSRDSNTYPAWYHRTGKGQAANLVDTENCAATGGGCYTMVDRGTFNRQVNGGIVTHLKIVAENNDPAPVRGGKNLLINPFSVYVATPTPPAPGYPAGSPTPNVAAAQRFVDFITSPQFQAKVAGFPSALAPAFLPDAAPGITLDTPLPRIATAGTALTIAGVVANRLPMDSGGKVSGIPVQLQQSANGGSTWSDVGAPANTDANGHFSVGTTFVRTTQYRLSTGTFPAPPAVSSIAQPYAQFSPATQVIGLVSLPTVTPPPSSGPKPDTTAPRVTRIKITRRGLSLRVSEGSDVKVLIQKRVRKGKKVRHRTVEVLRLGSTKGKLLRGHHKVLAKGRYRLRITATDALGNRRTLTKSFTR